MINRRNHRQVLWKTKGELPIIIPKLYYQTSSNIESTSLNKPIVVKKINKSHLSLHKHMLKINHLEIAIHEYLATEKQIKYLQGYLDLLNCC